MIADIVIPLIIVSLAELGDKTQLSILLLSSKTKKHLQLFLGVMLAFLIVDGFAILMGSWITDIIPEYLLKISSGIIFILFGLLILKSNEERNERRLYPKNPFLSGFLLIFITEWGDKTQIASALFVTKYSAAGVLIGVLTGLAFLSLMAVYLGKFISDKVDRKAMTKISGSLFILMGILFFLF